MDQHDAFGRERLSAGDVLREPQLHPVLERAFLQVCHELGISETDSSDLLTTMWRLAATSTSDAIEDTLGRTVRSCLSAHTLREALDRRSSLLVRQITPHLVGASLADIGCGDGLVGWSVSSRFAKTWLIDVIDYRDHRVTLPVHVYCEGASLPLGDGEVSTCLLLTVLHHSWDPHRLLAEVTRCTTQRAIVIESVFDVPRASVPLGALPVEMQRAYATFVDWLYNRVLHEAVPVPYNFGTPQEWSSLFTDAGWAVTQVDHLGIDQAVVPEYHVLYVLDRL